jgi:hypothetical protein
MSELSPLCAAKQTSAKAAKRPLADEILLERREKLYAAKIDEVEL